MFPLGFIVCVLAMLLLASPMILLGLRLHELEFIDPLSLPRRMWLSMFGSKLERDRLRIKRDSERKKIETHVELERCKKSLGSFIKLKETLEAKLRDLAKVGGNTAAEVSSLRTSLLETEGQVLGLQHRIASLQIAFTSAHARNSNQLGIGNNYIVQDSAYGNGHFGHGGGDRNR